MDQKTVPTEQQRWASKLLGLNYTIEYKPGSENRVADALSRRPHDDQYSELRLTTPLSLDKEDLANQIAADPELQDILQSLKKDKASNSSYKLAQGLLYKDHRLVIPSKSSFIPQLFEQFHSSPIGGHEGVLKTYKRMA